MRELKLTKVIMERESEVINKYLTDIARIPLLNVEEEERLCRMIREGDASALEQLVRTNLRFVVSVAKNYQYRGLSLCDLVSEGNLGLIRAARKFDHTRGFKFISFAVWWIRQSIVLAIAEQTRVIRLPLNLVNAISKINKTISRLEQELERLPTDAEISKAAAIPEARVAVYLIKANKPLLLDGFVSSESDSTMLSLIPGTLAAPDECLKIADRLSDVIRLLRFLPSREKQILLMHYGLTGLHPLGLEEIAVMLNLSKERVRQLRDGAIRKVRARSHRNHHFTKAFNI